VQQGYKDQLEQQVLVLLELQVQLVHQEMMELQEPVAWQGRLVQQE
jgi:hypothetical protein